MYLHQLSCFQIKQHVWDALILYALFLIMNISDFQGDLTDVSAETERMIGTCRDCDCTTTLRF